MKAIDIIRIMKNPLENLKESGINIYDIRHIEMYDKYLLLLKEGHKKTNTIYYLSQEFKISERTIYKTIGNFEKEIIKYA